MLEAPSKTQAAFLALLEALDAEIKELQTAGQERFHERGLPRAARPLLKDAVHRARIRDELAKLHEQWLHQAPLPPPPPPPPIERATPEERRRVARFKAMPGLSLREAAKRLGVRPAKLLGWLEGGLLKGKQLSRTKWKIAGQDLVNFAREHRDLL